jgi:hypothetical protein
MTTEQITVEIDCAPGAMRPSDYFPGVLEGTPLKPSDFDLVGTFFGNFTWALKSDKEHLYKVAKPVIQSRIEALYHSGQIRYGSW